MKTCWKSLPTLRVIGDTIMKKYNKAKMVQGIADKEGISLVIKRLVIELIGFQVAVFNHVCAIYIAEDQNYIWMRRNFNCQRGWNSFICSHHQITVNEIWVWVHLAQLAGIAIVQQKVAALSPTLSLKWSFSNNHLFYLPPHS